MVSAEGKNRKKSFVGDRECLGTLMSDVELEDIEWLWESLLPIGMVSVLEGDPGYGKSFLYEWIASRLSYGMNPDGRTVEPQNSIFLNMEDPMGKVILPRLMGEGADLQRIQCITYLDENTRLPRPLVLPGDIGQLEKEIIAFRAKFVAIDPLFNHLGDGIASGKDQEIRKALMPLADTAERTGAHIMCVRHLSKNTASAALHRGSGSVGIVGVARVVNMVLPDPDDKSSVIMVTTKSNLGPKRKAIRFQIRPDATGKFPRLFLTGTSSYSADEAIKANVELGEEGDDFDAEAFLSELLSSGPVKARDVKDKSAESGIKWHAIRKASDNMKIHKFREGGYGKDGCHFWALHPPLNWMNTQPGFPDPLIVPDQNGKL